MEKKIIKDALEDLVVAPSAGYLGMKAWGAYVDSLGGFFSQKYWSYIADVEKFAEGLPAGLHDFIGEVALNPERYSVGTAVACLAIGALDLMYKYNNVSEL
jgi:hypothetical protein